jgi:tight adherence protein C
MTNALGLLSSLCVVFAALVALYAVYGFFTSVPDEDREYRDPLPLLLRIVWPLVMLLDYFAFSRLNEEQLKPTQKALAKASLLYLLTPSQLMALRTLVTIGLGAVTILCFKGLELATPVPALLAVLVLGYYLPLSLMRDIRLKREKEILKSLPNYLDFLTLAVEAGLNLTGAIQQLVEKAPRGALHAEFARVQRDIKSGVPRLAALKHMGERLDIREIHTLVSAIAQSERTGASIGEVIRIQADQRRVERFQRAEKLAMEAPVKLVFPLVAFIFPVTFVILGFPIAMKFMYEM